MKKTLLLTTALVGSMALAQAAMAQEAPADAKPAARSAAVVLKQEAMSRWALKDGGKPHSPVRSRIR